MREKAKKEKKTSFWISRLLLWLSGLILVSFLALFLAFQLTSIQTKIINSITELVFNQTNFIIKFNYTNLTWYDKMLFKKVEIFDAQDSLMLSINEVKLNFSFFDLALSKELNIDELLVTDMILHIIKFADSTNVNINHFFRELSFVLNKENKPKANISIKKIILDNALFTFNDLRKPLIKTGKDYYHFGMDSIWATIKNFTQINDTINMTIVNFKGNDLTNQLNIKSLKGKYFFCSKRMSLYEYELNTDLSKFTDSLTLYYNNPGNLIYFVDSVRFYSSMDNCQINTKDLALFSTSLKDQNQKIILSGQFKGLIKRFSGKQVVFHLGQNTTIKGTINFNDLSRIKETFLDLNISESIIDAHDIIDFIPEKFQQKVLQAGIVDFKGQFLGFPTDFVVNGFFNTSIGYIQSEVNMKIFDDNTPLYSGNLVLKSFDLGKFLSNKKFYQNVNLSGNIKGSGLDLNTAHFFLNAKIDSIGIRDYEYKNIDIKGEFANQFFEGDLIINDPALKFKGFTTVDLREDREKFNFRARLDTLFLQPLGFSKENIYLATSIDADIRGLHIDSINGYVNLRNLEIKRNEEFFSIDSLKLLSFLIGDQRSLSLETDGMNCELKGNYKNSIVLKSIETILSELELSIINDFDSLNKYYEQKIKFDKQAFIMDIKLNLWDINRFLQSFYPDIRLSKKIIVESFFKSDEISQFTLNTHIDSVYYKNNLFTDNDLDIKMSKFFNSKNFLFSFFINSNEQIWNEQFITEKFNLDLIWSDNQIDIATNLEQSKFENNVNLQAKINFLKDSISFSFLNSNIHVFDKDWELDLNNKIVYTNSAYYFENVFIQNNKQSISINGVMSSKPENKMKINLSNFNISNFNSLFFKDIKGKLDGVIEVTNLENDILIENNILADNFYVEEFLLGDIYCLSKWENDTKRLNLSFEVQRWNKKIMNISGYFYPQRISNQLDMIVKFDSINLEIAQPFLKTQVDNLSGVVSGIFDLTGNLSDPVLKGKGKLANGKMKIKYLNTNYTFNGGIVFDENEISFKNLVFYDYWQNHAVFNGGMSHDGFRNFVLDIDGQFKHFKMLNTTSVDNKLYYGTAFVTGNIEFLGTLNNLQINAETKTEKGTRISIPVGGLSEYTLEQKEYINFVELRPIILQEKVEKVEDKINLKGIKLDFDIEMTNDAYIELIFDAIAGDIIRGRGNGNINLQIDTNGDFNMFGDLEIEKGGYNFTLYNIINKEFKIRKGSQISWYGDPYGANLNIQAEYRQLASLEPIIIEYNNNVSNSPEIKKKYPSIVNMDITGKLFNPDIKFEIEIEDYPNILTLNNNNSNSIELQAIVTAFKAKLKQNEQEMKRQVFSLIILKKISSENSFSVNSNTIGNSFSEFISNQLSYWIVQVDENLEIDVNLAGLDADAFNDFQLRLSYTFFGGRLRITRGGEFSNIGNQTNPSSIIGDWTVEYLLTNDGQLRAKVYNRTNLNSVTTQINDNSTSAGFSFQYVRSFDELKRILADKRNKNKLPAEKKYQNQQNMILLNPWKRKEYVNIE